MSSTSSGDLDLLLVEDDPLDRRIVRRHLKQARVAARLVEVPDLAAAERALAERFDCVLLDLDLPDGSGLDLLRRLEAAGALDAPVVVLTGHLEAASACLQAGAQDYLVKGEYGPDALCRAIRYARERWRLVREVQEQRRELARSNEELERFAQVASHDLQQPLRALGWLCSLLEERCGGALDERGAEYLSRIRGAGERMQRLVDDLLDLSRVQRGPFRPTRVSLEELLPEVLADLAGDLEQAGAEVELGPLPCVRGGRSELARLFTNLLTNALRFRDASRPLRVQVSAAPANERGRVEVSVRDNGIGFPKEHAETIFLPFRRLEPERSQGSGIGLAVCRAIAERCGGALVAAGAPHTGATFRLVLEGLE
ncbi:MAG: ATP-binding protein [Planctomycetota bacterium]